MLSDGGSWTCFLGGVGGVFDGWALVFDDSPVGRLLFYANFAIIRGV